MKRELLTKAKRIAIDRSKGSMYNSWRSKVYTAKGKSIGFPESWTLFKNFENDMKDGWSKGKVLVRLDTSKPYSKENCKWADKGDESLSKLTKLTYKGITKTLAEWCVEYNLNYNGVRQRFFKGKNYSTEQILFGKRMAKCGTITSALDLTSEQALRNKVSKMLSAYRCTDKKKGLMCDITFDQMLDIVKTKKCAYCGCTDNIGLDRIDNSKGHTIDNVVPCCYMCNVVRNNLFSHEEMLKIGKFLRKIIEERNEHNCKKDCEEG